MPRKRRSSRQTPHPTPEYRAETIAGITDFAARELTQLGAAAVQPLGTWCTFASRDIAALLPRLRTVHAVYAAASFTVPRPKALLGDEHFRRILPLLEAARRTARFSGLRIEAAGKDSPVMVRLGNALANAAGLPFAPETGDLTVRVARSRVGWDVLVRLTTRPLSARPWRVCNMPGGLHAPLAVVMNELAGGNPGARYLNVMAGSGTLAIEHAQSGGRALAVEVAGQAVACAAENIAAAGVQDRVELVSADVFAPSPVLPPGSFDVITANPPWGDAVGSHASNDELHQRLLTRAHELLAPGGVFVLVTHEVKLLHQLLRGARAEFSVRHERQVAHGGHHPLVVKLEAR